jgi:hypothetical protein
LTLFFQLSHSPTFSMAAFHFENKFVLSNVNKMIICECF